MGRALATFIAQDDAGNVQKQTPVTIYEADGTTLLAQTMYAGPSGGTTKSNPLTTDNLGRAIAYVDTPQRAIAECGGLPFPFDFSDDPADLVSVPGIAANGGTGTNTTLTTPSISGGTQASPAIATPTVTGGTFDSPTLDTPTITTPTVTNGTWTGASLTDPDVTNGEHVSPIVHYLQVVQEISDPAAPGAGLAVIYPKSDGNWWARHSGGAALRLAKFTDTIRSIFSGAGAGAIPIADGAGGVVAAALGTAHQELNVHPLGTGIQWYDGTRKLLNATGAMVYASAANTLAKLAIGTSGALLNVSGGGVPAWTQSPAVTGSVTAGTYVLAGGNLFAGNQLAVPYRTPYANQTLAANAAVVLGTNVTIGKALVIDDSHGAMVEVGMNAGTSQPVAGITTNAANWSIGSDPGAGANKIAVYWTGTQYVVQNRFGSDVTIDVMMQGRV